jgi:hypothetical protein
MARGVPSAPQHAGLKPEAMRTGIRRLEQCIDQVEAFDPASLLKRDELTAIASAMTATVESALGQTFGYGTVEYRSYVNATDFSWPINSMHPTPVDKIVASLRSRRTSSLALLRQAVSFLEGELELAPPATPSSPATRPNPSRKVFVVHGRDDATKNEVALFLTSIGLEPIILHTRPHGGRNILTKFQEESEGAAFAVILMTPDDEGAFGGETLQKRARQNVVFELGFFIGKLGTPNVAALVKGHIEKPSDFDGIGYIDFDAKGEWKRLLAREMQHAQIPFDASKVLTA